MVETIPSDLDDAFRESLVSKIKYGNEYSLRKRLKQLIDKYPVVSTFIHNRKQFVDDVVKTRNYMTHYDEHLKGEAKTSWDLYELLTQLRHLLEVCLLSEIGIPTVKVEELVKRNQRIRMLKD
jgi:hypothetical protein